MSQESVYKLLKKKDEWMSTEEITNKLGNSRSCILHSLSKLNKWGEIMKKEKKEFNHYIYLWRIK